MINHKKLSAKVCSIALTVAMVVTAMMPGVAFADDQTITKAITIGTEAPVTGATIADGTNTPPTGADAPTVTWSADGGSTWTATGTFVAGIAYQTKYEYKAQEGYVFVSGIQSSDITVSGGTANEAKLTDSNKTLTVKVTWPATAQIIGEITIGTTAPVTGAQIENGVNTPPTGANEPTITWSADGGNTWKPAGGTFQAGIIYQTKYVYTAKSGYAFDPEHHQINVSVSHSVDCSDESIQIIVSWPETVGPDQTIDKAITIGTEAPVTGATIADGTNTPPTGADAPTVTWSADGGSTWTATGTFAAGIAYQTKYEYKAQEGYVFDSGIQSSDITVTNGGTPEVTPLSGDNKTLTVTVTWPATAAADQTIDKAITIGTVAPVTLKEITDGTNTPPTGADAPTVTWSADGGNTWTATGTFQAGIAYQTKYEYKAQEGYVFDSGIQSSDITVTNGGTPAVTPLSGDKKTLTVTITWPATTKLDATFSMTKAQTTVQSGKATTGVTFELPPLPDGAKYASTGTTGGNKPELIDGTPSVNGTTLTFNTTSQSGTPNATITVQVTGATNYNDYETVVKIFTSEKQQVRISASVADKIYDGAAVQNPSVTAVTNDSASTPVSLEPEELGFSYYKQNGSSWGFCENPSEVGNYKLTIAVDDTTYKGEKDIYFKISPATITIKANDKSAYVGDAAPALTAASDYTVTGLAAGENLANAPTLSYAATPDMSKAGTVAIKASGAAVPTGGNYNDTITYADGTLTVNAKPSPAPTPGGGGSSGGGSGGGSHSGGGGGGGSSAGSSSSAKPVTAETSVTANVDKDGHATATVTDQTISDAVKEAKAQADKNGITAGDITAVIKVDTGSKDAGSVSVNLSKAMQQQVESDKVAKVAIELSKQDITLGMDLNAIKSMNKQASADVQLSITRLDTSKLSAEAKDVIGGRPAFDLKATYNDGKNSITSFGAGTVSVEIPYTLQQGEVAGNVCAVYVDDNGKVNYLSSSSYDSKAKAVRFTTDHFSVYGVGYKENTPSVSFTDIADHWAKQDIEFVAGKGLMSGTGNGMFTPDGAMTRGMFVTTLGRLAGVNGADYTNGKFSDVSADAYYAPYVNWAAEKGIVSGTSATTFSPDQSVTRQEMAVMMSNYAKAMGNKLPQTHQAITFTDASSIADWAAEAVQQMQMAGIISGRDDNSFDPAGTATRGEVASLLHRFVEAIAE